MSTYVDRVYLLIGDKEVECSSVKRSQDDGAKVVGTMNRENRAKGHAHGIMKYNMDVEFPLDADSDIDPEQMHEDREEFTTVVEEEGGRVINYLNSRFSKVDVDSKEGDESTVSATILPLDRVAS